MHTVMSSSLPLGAMLALTALYGCNEAASAPRSDGGAETLDASAEAPDDAGADAANADLDANAERPPICAKCSELANRYVETLRKAPEVLEPSAPGCAIVLDTNVSFCSCGVDTFATTDCAMVSPRTGACLAERDIEDCTQHDETWCEAQCAPVVAAWQAEQVALDAELLDVRCIEVAALCVAAIDIEGECRDFLFAEDGSVMTSGSPDLDAVCGGRLCPPRDKCTMPQ